jgi:hypothetical protein
MIDRLFRRRPEPIPLGPRHRRLWRRWGRWCSCGLGWKTCPDRRWPVPTEPPTPPRHARVPKHLSAPAPNQRATPNQRSAHHQQPTPNQRSTRHERSGDGPVRNQSPSWDQAPWWDQPTRVIPALQPQVGRPGQLTPAQTWRANGGRW